MTISRAEQPSGCNEGETRHRDSNNRYHDDFLRSVMWQVIASLFKYHNLRRCQTEVARVVSCKVLCIVEQERDNDNKATSDVVRRVGHLLMCAIVLIIEV